MQTISNPMLHAHIFKCNNGSGNDKRCEVKERMGGAGGGIFSQRKPCRGGDT